MKAKMEAKMETNRKEAKMETNRKEAKMETNRKHHSMEELKAAFASKKSDTANISEFYADWFDFWKLEVGKMAVVRFLPDANDNNPMEFLVERVFHKVGNRKVPCTLAPDCTHCTTAQAIFNIEQERRDAGELAEADALHAKALSHYKKKEYIGQVKVIDAGGVEYDPSKELHFIALGPKLFKVIQAAFASGDLDNPPCDIRNGYDFRIRKTKQGEFGDYSTSNFAPKPTELANGPALTKKVVDLGELLKKLT